MRALRALPFPAVRRRGLHENAPVGELLAHRLWSALSGGGGGGAPAGRMEGRPALESPGPGEEDTTLAM